MRCIFESNPNTVPCCSYPCHATLRRLLRPTRCRLRFVARLCRDGSRPVLSRHKRGFLARVGLGNGPEWRCASSSSSSSSSSISRFDDENENEDEDEDDHDVSFLFSIRPQADGPTEPRNLRFHKPEVSQAPPVKKTVPAVSGRHRVFHLSQSRSFTRVPVRSSNR
jgi:hypothetical protein